MIDLNDGFSDIIPNSGKYAKAQDYVLISDDICHIRINRSYDEVVKYFGNTVSLMANGDASIIVLIRGNDRRIGSHNKSISATQLKERFTGVFGENVHKVFLDGCWDEDQRGRKVFVLKTNGKREYDADITYRKLDVKK